MKPILFAFPQNDILTQHLHRKLDCELGQILCRHFPDGESYVRIDSLVKDRELIFVCSLDRSDEKILPLLFAAQNARELGASRIGLVTPYLGYMRQDQRFQPGEGIHAHYFANLLSKSFDWLITVDPHLHRIDSLNQIYSIPTAVVHAAPALAEWIKHNVASPLLIGPDEESEQWVADLAAKTQAPYLVLEKKRFGDRQVEITFPFDHVHDSKRTCVLMDDIISTAQTMIKTLQQLQHKNHTPICLGVHAVFAGQAYQELLETGARVVTCNTIHHISNEIDLSSLLVESLQKMLTQ